MSPWRSIRDTFSWLTPSASANVSWLKLRCLRSSLSATSNCSSRRSAATSFSSCSVLMRRWRMSRQVVVAYVLLLYLCNGSVTIASTWPATGETLGGA